jgi:transposase
MTRTRKTFSSEFKAKVALEAIKGYKSLSELAKEFKVHPNAIGNWKKEVLEGLPEIFDNKRGPKAEANSELIEELYKQIGKQQVELNWFKKKFNNIS